MMTKLEYFFTEIFLLILQHIYRVYMCIILFTGLQCLVDLLTRSINQIIGGGGG